MVLVVMVSTQYLVYSLPVIKPTTEAISTKKVNEKRNTQDEIRLRLHQLEHIERYYQHLYIRGLLEENDSQHLERLQNVIEQLRQYLNVNNM
ncbi:hypothetical protein ACF0H5_017330 [Mactra antiquata]